MQPVCLVIGAGAGIGSHVGSRFAREGYHAVLCRRTDQEGLDRSVASIRGEGGAASGFLLNAVAPDTIEERIAAVEADIGPIEVVVYNLGAQIGDRPLADTSHKVFELGWRLATFGLFRTAASVCPLMEKRGRGPSSSHRPPPRCAATRASIPMRLPWQAGACCARPSTRSSAPRAFTSRTSSSTAWSMRPIRSAGCWARKRSRGSGKSGD